MIVNEQVNTLDLDTNRDIYCRRWLRVADFSWHLHALIKQIDAEWKCKICCEISIQY